MTRARLSAPALAMIAAAASACSSGASSPTFTVRKGAALSPAAAPAQGPVLARVLHFGDFGERTREQAAVASAMATAHRRAPFDVAIAVGDLVYPCGPDPAREGADACAFAAGGNTVAAGTRAPADPAYALHEAPLAFLGPAPVYVALGNHDVATGGYCGAADPRIARRKACLAVAHASPHWTMPGRHYAVDRGPARFLVFDSNLLLGDYGGFSLEDEVAFVAAQAEDCATRPCFLVGHHPPATAGSHRDEGTPEYLARVGRLLAAGQGRIRAYLAGHDHDLQHLRTRDGVDVLVSGSTSSSRDRERFEATSADARLLFGSVRWGYGVLEIAADGWRYRFEGDRSEPIYCCAAIGTGPCEPTSCK